MKNPQVRLTRASLLIGWACAALLGGGIAWLGIRVAADRASRANRPSETFTADPWIDTLARFPMPPYARHLKDVRIVLDPGHGGRANRPGWKRGPTGLREAEVNLRVAEHLRDFLEAVGAQVIMTRAADVYLDPDDGKDLSARAAIANRWPADLLLSIHHNAGADPNANYTSVYYHGAPDHNAVSIRAARFIWEALNDALRLEQLLDCGVVSDYTIFPDKGFRILRDARVPAILSEAAFHSNPEEEQRLRDATYNRREAYGLFIGLARWAQAGLPRVRLVEPADGRLQAGKPIVLRLDDGLSGRGGLGMKLPQFVRDSIVVGHEGAALPFDFIPDRMELRVAPPARLARAGGLLYVDFENIFGQHVIHSWIELSGNR